MAAFRVIFDVGDSYSELTVYREQLVQGFHNVMTEVYGPDRAEAMAAEFVAAAEQGLRPRYDHPDSGSITVEYLQ